MKRKRPSPRRMICGQSIRSTTQKPFEENTTADSSRKAQTSLSLSQTSPLPFTTLLPSMQLCARFLKSLRRRDA